jgi:hypothetical protein
MVSYQNIVVLKQAIFVILTNNVIVMNVNQQRAAIVCSRYLHASAQRKSSLSPSLISKRIFKTLTQSGWQLHRP